RRPRGGAAPTGKDQSRRRAPEEQGHLGLFCSPHAPDGLGSEVNPMLINCIAYQDGRKLADIRVAEIHTYITRPNCFVWVALKDASDDELQTMQREFNLHELAIEDAHQGHQRPKVEEYGESLFTVLHLVEQIDGELHVGEI